MTKFVSIYDVPCTSAQLRIIPLQRELDRLDMAHVLQTKIIGDRLQLAPVDFEKPLRVLDIGTGTGTCTF